VTETLFNELPAAPAPAPVAAGRPRPVVIGLDLSLTSTGVAGEGWTDRIRTRGLRGDARLVYLLHAVRSFIRSADLVVMEGPAYGHAALAGHEDLAGLRVLVRVYCHQHQIPYAVVPPSTLKLYVAGYGRASKGEVRSAVRDRYGIECEGPARYDEADAYSLVAAAYDWLGLPLAVLPDRQRAALDGVAWPDREAVIW
jgi:Holliday junction resolvasome RuvABC endonuclease subunit